MICSRTLTSVAQSMNCVPASTSRFPYGCADRTISNVLVKISLLGLTALGRLCFLWITKLFTGDNRKGVWINRNDIGLNC